MEKKNITNWDLIAAKLHRELTEEENVVFEKWENDEGNRFAYFKANKIHDGLERLKGVNKSSSWKRTHQKIRHSAFKRYTLISVKYAAIVLFAFLIGSYFHSFQSKRGNIKYAEIDVLNGQMGHLFLFDGTEVWLNSGSHFKYPDKFNQDEREVFLTGEAFFKVTHNKHLPFIVKTDKMEVKVLGTSFNVSAYHDEDKQSVVLVEGKVWINSGDGNKIGELNPGQRASLNRNSAKIQIDNVRTGQYTDWKEGKVVFDSEQLGEIAKKLERWYNVEINFESEDLKQYRITGTILRNKPIDQTIRAIELLAPVKYEHIPQISKKDIINIKAKQ